MSDQPPWGPIRRASRGEMALRLAAPVVVAVATFAAFRPALEGEFVDWDDDRMLLLRDEYRGLGWTNLRWMFTTFHMGHYQPLSWISLAIDYKIHGLDPYGFHLTNVLLHVAVAVLFYFLSRRLIALALPGKAGVTGLSLAASAAALLFSIHPLRVESVAWVTERRDVLSGAFFVAALLCYVRSAAGAGRAVRRWYALSILMTALSLLSKAWGMALPVLMVILDAYPLRRLPGPTERLLSWPSVRLALRKWPHALLALLAALMAYRAQERQEWGVLSLATHGIWSRFVQAFYGIAFYALRTLVPRDLSPLYEIPRELEVLSQPFVLGFLSTIGLTAAAWVFRRRFPAGLGVWTAYLVTVAPVLGVAQSGPQFVADRYSYLSCLGFAVLAGGLLLAAVGLPGTPARVLRIAATGAASAVALGVFGTMTWRQSMVWRNSLTLWERVLEISPESWIANDNYGTVLTRRRRAEEAVPFLQRATELNPDSGHAWHQLGVALRIAGRHEEAIAAYLRALPGSPSPGETLFELGFTHSSLNRLEEAVQYYERAAVYKKVAMMARVNLGRILRELGRYDEAAQQYELALQFDPTLDVALRGLEAARRRR